MRTVKVKARKSIFLIYPLTFNDVLCYKFSHPFMKGGGLDPGLLVSVLQLLDS